MKPVLIATAALISIAVSSWSTPAPPPANPGPEVIELKTATMQLKFPHKKHQSILKIECGACHKSGNDKKNIWGTQTAHTICMKCHHAQVKGPKDCRSCHKFK